MSIHDVLNKIQRELQVPKTQYNSFAKFHYRSCEDILEAVKKLLPDGVSLTITDEMVMIGDRYYVKAHAFISDNKSGFGVNAYAREPLEKKGSDASQITGAASSYARKYALAGLFLIDDSKDADSKDNSNVQPGDVKVPLHLVISRLIKEKNIPLTTVDKMKAFAGVEDFKDATEDKLQVILEKIS